MFVRVDVSDESAVRTMVDTVLAQFGRVDMLVNDAGISIQHLVEDMPVQDWDRVLSVNLRGTYLRTRVLFGQILERDPGGIINIASQLGQIGGAEVAQHAASKTAVSGFTKSLAREVSGRGVLVNAIAPGPIHTPLLDGETEAWRRATLAELPIRRFGKVSEVTPTALLLASDDGSYPLRHVDVQLRRCPRSRAALLGARAGRRILEAVLGELVADGDLDARKTTDIARRILGATAWDLNGLTSALS